MYQYEDTLVNFFVFYKHDDDTSKKMTIESADTVI